MSQSIASMSAVSIAAYQSSETYQGQGASFTLSKDVGVVSSSGATDMVDLSPDARKALQSFLSGGSTGTGQAGKAASPGSSDQSSGDAVEISVTAATSSTTGRQPDHATASEYDISWTAADGETGSLEVAESSSFTTDQQLGPLGPQLQASGANNGPGITTSAAHIAISDGLDGPSASTTAIRSYEAVQDTDDGEAALMMLEASLKSLGDFSSAKKAGSSSGTFPLQDV